MDRRNLRLLFLPARACVQNLWCRIRQRSREPRTPMRASDEHQPAVSENAENAMSRSLVLISERGIQIRYLDQAPTVILVPEHPLQQNVIACDPRGEADPDPDVLIFPHRQYRRLPAGPETCECDLCERFRPLFFYEER